MDLIVPIAALVGGALLILFLFLRRRSGDESGSQSASEGARPDVAPELGTVVPAPWEDDDDDDEITMVTTVAEDDACGQSVPSAAEVGLDVDLGSMSDGPSRPSARAFPLVVDAGAENEVPTLTTEPFLVTASRQTDVGLSRKRNEDRYLIMKDHCLFAVADGMGGYRGGALAASLAVNTLQQAFSEERFEARIRDELPKPAEELASAIQMANLAIWGRAQQEPALQGMGTTVAAARFLLRKQRLYVGHVGDSRCYRLRGGALRQLSVDHTLEGMGVTGPNQHHLVRALGIGPKVEIDVIMAEPRVHDVYLLCSDGLTRMVNDDVIREILVQKPNLEEAAQSMIDAANAKGGKDNISVVLVAVRPPSKAVE